MKYLFILFVFLPSLLVSQDYELTAFQDEYVEIENYNSILIESRGDIYWSKQFSLSFDFPFFDEVFNELSCNSEGACYFENEPYFSIRLLTFGYEYDNILDTSNIESDVRYKFTTKNGLEALVLQFTKNRLISDTTVEEFDSYINFQYWFYENGTIELIMGEQNLDNSAVYVPGEGFYLLTTEGPILAGPEVALYHPSDKDRRYSYNDKGSYQEYELINSSLGTMNYLPPSGWTIRFERRSVATDESSLINQEVTVFPNPVNDNVSIEGREHEIISYEIYSLAGRKVLSGKYLGQINVESLKKGMYFIKMQTDNTDLITQKIYKL